MLVYVYFKMYFIYILLKCISRLQINRFENFIFSVCCSTLGKDLLTPKICRTDDFNVNTLMTFRRQKMEYKTLANSFSYV